MVRTLALVLAVGACTPAQAPVARKVGKWMSLGGVTGLVGMAFASPYTDSDPYAISVFSLISAIGIATFAAGDLSAPASVQETIPERNHRWAMILTERAGRYAREDNCPRVRRVEPRIRFYDRDVHDFVFMKDAAIARCMSPPEDPAQVPVPVQVPDPEPEVLPSPDP